MHAHALSHMSNHGPRNLTSPLLFISRREGGGMKNEWLPYGSGRLRKKREAIGVENQFRQVADI